MLRHGRGLILVLAATALSIALPVALVPASASQPSVDAAKKKCKKGQKRVKGKCKKSAPSQGKYSGDAIITSFELKSNIVYMQAVIPVAASPCAPAGTLVTTTGDTNPMVVKNNKFALSGTFGDDQGSGSFAITGKFTDSKTVTGTVQVKATYGTASCDSGVKNFTVKHK